MWLSKLFVLFCFLIINIHANASVSQTSADPEDERVYQTYIELDKNLKSFVNRGIKMLLPYAMEAREHVNLSTSCTRDMMTLLSGIRSLKLDALKILDSVGKLHPGFLVGNVEMLGEFNECLGASILQRNGDIAFKGEYCMVNVRPLLPKRKKHVTMKNGLDELIEATRNASEFIQFSASIVHLNYDLPIKFGLCVPSGCSFEDVSQLLNYVGQKVNINATVEYCDPEIELPTTVGRIVAIVAFSIVGVLVVIGSFIDYYSKRKGITIEDTRVKLLLCFSVFDNFSMAIATKAPADARLSSLFGIRALSLFYIVLLHDYFLQGRFQVQGHLLSYRYEITEFFFQIVPNGMLTVEVFFFIGGLLNAYVSTKSNESGKGKSSIIRKIIHRLWRIYPAYLFALLSSYILAEAYGPMRIFAKEEFLDKCATYWWRNVLFINNFFDHKQLCLSHSWYVAADMQLFLLSLFTYPVLFRRAKLGLILHAAIIATGISLTVIWAWHKEVLPSLIVNELDMNIQFRMWNIYASFIPHIAPYFTGIHTGYILFKCREFKIPVVWQIFGWSLSSAGFISMLFITKMWNSGTEVTRWGSAMYFGFCRFVYVLPIAWLIVCSARGYGGILNYILSLKIWIPISRLSYMWYLVSPIVQVFYFSNLRMEIDNNRMVIIWRYMGTLLITGLMSLVLVVITESPFIAMGKIVFRPRSKKVKPGQDVEAQDINIVNGSIQTRIEGDKNFKNVIELIQ